MKIECVKEKFLEAIQKADKFNGKNLTLPILSCIALETINSELVIRATNLDIGIEITLPVKVIEQGKTVLLGSSLINFLSNLAGENKILFEVVDQVISIKTEKASTTFKSYSYEDFPIIPKIEGGKIFFIQPQEFAFGVKSVSYSAAVTSMKPELSSVYIYVDQDDLVFAATDSFRLAEKRVKIKKGKELGSVLIPYKNIIEITKILENIKSDVSIHLNSNQISFTSEGLYIVSRVIDGVFPDYKQIIPKEHKTEIVVLKQDLISSLKLANVFSDALHQVVMKIVPGDKFFELSTRNNEVGEGKLLVESVLKGEDLTISFNFKYITDCFQSLDSDSVSLSFSGIGRPLLVRGVSDMSFLYIVMPMNK